MSAPFTTSRAMAMSMGLKSLDHHHRDKSSRRRGLIRRTRQTDVTGG